LNEFIGADFGDARLSKRLLKLVERLAVDPAVSFPEACRTDAELEATYRFFGNEAGSNSGSCRLPSCAREEPGRVVGAARDGTAPGEPWS
jgi:hypothetical protein